MTATPLLGADGTVVVGDCRVAETAASRLRGLLGRDGLPEDEALLLRPSNSVHMFFMRFPLDVVFLGADGTVVKIVPRLRPWRAAGCLRAKAVLELAAGTCERRGLRVGHRLELPVGPRTRAHRPAGAGAVG